MIINRDYSLIMRQGRRLLTRNPPISQDNPSKIVFYEGFIQAVLIIGILLAMLYVAGCDRALAGELPIGYSIHVQTVSGKPYMKASWYSVESLKREGTWKHSKGRMANGHIFSDSGYTCATRFFPLGSILRVQTRDLSRSVIVRVTDRIGKRFAKQRIDLSKAAFEKLSSLDKGLINVYVERIK